MRMSIAASLIARISSIALQVVSLPIAAAALTSSGFAVYALASAILGWLSLSSFGLGPALTIRVSTAVGNDDALLARNQFATGASIMFMITLAISLILIVMLEYFGVAGALFSKTGVSEDEAYQIMYAICGVFFFTTLILSFESAQMAMQESYYLNGYSAVGALVAAGATLYEASGDPTPLHILLAVQIPMIVFRLMNAIHFSFRYSSLIGGVIRPKLIQVKELFLEGMHFFLSGSVANFLAHVFPILLIGTLAKPHYTASAAAVMNAIIILSSFFSLINQPMLGALPEALVRNDRQWISRAYRFTITINVIFAAAVFGVLSLIGTQLFDFWYQGSIHPSREMLIFAGLYFFLLAFDITHFTFLAGCSRLASASSILLIRTAVYAVLLYCFATPAMDSLPFALLALSSLTLSLIPLALKWRQWFKLV